VNTIDQLVLAAAAAFLQRGDSGWLCTVVKTFGASPRPLGSIMAMDEHGNLHGSLSGGCIEDELLSKLQRGELAVATPVLLEYGVSPEENERFGLPCGGKMQVLIEPLAPTKLQCDLLNELSVALAARQPIRRHVDLRDGNWRLEAITGCQSLSIDDNFLQQDFGPRFQLLLIGANELARCIAESALAMDYRVLVCDPREDRRGQWSVSGAELLADMPDDAVSRYGDSYTAVVTLTHDPRIDDMALMQALTQPLFYVGALGSQRTSDKRRERLLSLDITASQLQQLHAPVGLAIGSKSAMEIALAIMAELTLLRAGQRRADLGLGVS
jgi:xanthine dehydrogenase accessory factor